MANDVNVVNTGQFRIFVQVDGSKPSSPYYYYGCLSLGGLSEELGAGTPTFCPSSDQRNKWDIIDVVPSVPGLPTTDFTQRMDRYLQDIWWELRKRGCRVHMMIVADTCGRPDDINQFDGKIAMRYTKLTNFALPEMNPLAGDGNAAADLTGSLELTSFDPIRRLRWGEKLGSLIVAEALDAVYAEPANCDECLAPKRQYILTAANSGSPGLSSQLVVSLDGGDTGISLDIPTLGGLSGSRLAAVGLYAVVVSEANGAHHWALLSNLDAGIAAWTRQASGYVASKSPRCIYSESPTRTYVGGAGGYIYLMTSPTKPVTPLTDGTITAQNVNDIHGKGRLLLSGGNSNTLMFSDNQGETFTLITGPEPGQNLSAVWVIDENIWWVGTGNGNLYFTENGGSTWTESTPDTSLTVINDIHFVDDIVGYFTGQVGSGSSAARAYRTADNGNSWHNTSPYLAALPSAERYNVIVADGYNNALAAGRASAGGDGRVAVAE